MTQNENTQKTADSMQATLTLDDAEYPFITDDVESGVHHGKRWFQGYQVAQAPGAQQETFTQITLMLPEECLSEGKTLVIGKGEDAEISAYLGSTSIGRSGWATQGEITIDRWDEETRQLNASFRFDIEAVNGEVHVTHGSLCIALASERSGARAGAGRVQATLAPVIFQSLGDLDAKDISFVDLSDGRIRLSAMQQGQSAAQGVHVVFNAESASMFFVIDNGIYDMPGGNLQHSWDEQTQRLTINFNDQVVTYQGQAHLISNGILDATRT